MHPRYIAFDNGDVPRPLIALDIGYSAGRRTCGIATSFDSTEACLSFGEALEKVRELCSEVHSPLLVIEAPLSSRHVDGGNPEIRGDFEKGRGWYWGSGAVALLAASRFLNVLHSRLSPNIQVSVAEAFHSNKPKKTVHSTDAMDIVRDFWKEKPQALAPGLEPTSPLVIGVPSVRVFRAQTAR